MQAGYSSPAQAAIRNDLSLTIAEVIKKNLTESSSIAIEVLLNHATLDSAVFTLWFFAYFWCNDWCYHKWAYS